MIEVLLYKMHLTQRGVFLYQTSDLTWPRYKMQQDKNFPVSSAKVWKVAKHVLVNQVRGFQLTKVLKQKSIWLSLCPDCAGHPSRDGVLLIVGVQVFRLGLFVYPSLTPGGHNQSLLWLKMKYLILNFTPDNAYLYAGVHPLPWRLVITGKIKAVRIKKDFPGFTMAIVFCTTDSYTNTFTRFANHNCFVPHIN